MTTLLAYIDPATTALVWQILAGVFISLGVVFAIWWRKITNFFKSVWVKLFRKNKKDAQQQEKELDPVDEELVDEEFDEKTSEK